jgi:hypothetical protein
MPVSKISSLRYYTEVMELLSQYTNDDGSPNKTKIARVLVKRHGGSWESFRAIVRNCLAQNPKDNTEKLNSTTRTSNKKKAKFHWRDMIKHARKGQEIVDKARYSQSFSTIDIQTQHPIVIVPFGDAHLGAIGTDYELFEKISDEVLNTPELYITLEGDELEMAIKRRNVREDTAGQVLTPEMQVNMLESWLNDMKHKILFAGWGNHAQHREEAVIGFSTVSRLIGKDKNIIYHNGIGHVDVVVNGFVYKIASSHLFRGNSFLNPCHAQQRYMRFQAPDREICIAGHTHNPAFMFYYDGENPRLALNTASLNVNSGFAKRWFSLFTVPNYPVIELSHLKKEFIPFKNLECWRLHNQGVVKI